MGILVFLFRQGQRREAPIPRTTRQSAHDLRGRSLHLHDFMAVISLDIYNIAIATLQVGQLQKRTEENCNSQTRNSQSKQRTRTYSGWRSRGANTALSIPVGLRTSGISSLCLQYRRLPSFTTPARLISNPDLIPRE